MANALLERLFSLTERKTTVRREVLAGLTTFVAMAYIIFVVPGMLADTGMPRGAAMVATIFSTVIVTAIMGLYANFPVGVAPGMGLTAFFSYYVCGTMGLPWTVALGAVFISGVFFLILTVTHIRQIIIDSVPMSLKYAIVVGSGMFIAFIGLRSAGIVVADNATLVTLGSMVRPEPLFACFGLLLSGVLMARNIQGSLLIGILCTTLISMLLGFSATPDASRFADFSFFKEWGTVFFKVDILGALQYGLISIIFSFTIFERFDTMGTLIGLSRKAGFIESDGHIKNLDKALMTDATGTIVSSFMGTPTVTSYIESAAGVSQGGRTGLTALTVAALFALSLLLVPLIEVVPSFATAPALILVGGLMMADVRHINFDDMTECLPAFLTIIMMPLTYSIANGFAFGFVTYVVMKSCSGRWREVNPFMWIISLVFIINFVLRGLG